MTAHTGKNMRAIKLVAAILIVLSSGRHVFAQRPVSGQEEYESTSIENRGFEERDWKKAVAGLDYNKDVKPARKRSLPGPGSWGIDREAAKVLIILLGAVALAFVLYHFFGKVKRPANKRVDTLNSNVFDTDKLEDELMDAPFESYIQQAVQQGQFTLAIRLHYLWALQTLARGQFIQWKKDKTNNALLAELQSTNLSAPFSQATALYEWVWYGDQVVTPQNYEAYARLFAPLTVELAASPGKSAAR